MPANGIENFRRRLNGPRGHAAVSRAGLPAGPSTIDAKLECRNSTNRKGASGSYFALGPFRGFGKFPLSVAVMGAEILRPASGHEEKNIYESPNRQEWT